MEKENISVQTINMLEILLEIRKMDKVKFNTMTVPSLLESLKMI